MDKTISENKTIYLISFFTYIGYYIGLELIILAGYINISRFYSIPLRFIISLLMIIIIIKNKFSFTKQARQIQYIFWTFWILYFVAIFKEIIFPTGKLYFSQYDYIGFSLSYCIIPFLYFSLYQTRNTLEILKKAIIHSGLILSIITIIFYGEYFLSGVGRINNLEHTENGGYSVISPLALSYSSSIIISMCSYFLLFEKLKSKTKVYYWIIICLSIIPFMFGSSRGSLITLLFSVSIIIYYKGNIRIKLKAFIIIFGLLLSLIYLSNITGSTLFLRISNTFTNIESDASNQIRMSQWQSAYNQFKRSPIIGDSIQCEVPPYPHNIFLEVLMSVGILGFIPFLIFILKTLIRTIKLIKRRPEYAWISIIFIHGIVLSQVSGTLFTSILLWAGSGLIYSIKLNDLKNNFSRY